METSRVALRGEQPDYIHAVTANVGYKKKIHFCYSYYGYCRVINSKRLTSLLRIPSSQQSETFERS